MITEEEHKQAPGLIELFLVFLKIGVSAFGGPALVSYVRDAVVEEKKWLDDEAVREGLGLSQMLPGAIIINLCTYLGLRIRGLAGSAASFLGMGLPAFATIFILSMGYLKFKNLPEIIAAFGGLKAVIVAIIAYAIVTFSMVSLKKPTDIFIALAAALLLWFKVFIPLVILLAAVAGMILFPKNLVPDKTYMTGVRQSRSTFWFLISVSALLAAILLALFLLRSDLFLLCSKVLRVALFAFGGGYAALPVLYNEFVEPSRLVAPAVFADGIILGQITPGPVIITATFLGVYLSGIAGGLFATVYIYIPSFVIVNAVAPYYHRICSSGIFMNAIRGIVSSFSGLLLWTGVSIAGSVSWSEMHVIMSLAAFIILLFRVNVIWVVLIGTIVSVIPVFLR